MKSRIFLLILIISTLSHPTTAQQTRYPLQKAADIDTLFYLPPFTGILYVGDDGEKSYDPEVNDRAQQKLQAVMDSLAAQTKLGSAIAVTPEQEERIAAELTTLFDAARKKPARYHDLVVPPVTDSVLTASGKRYVMLVALRGMTRSRENRRKLTRRAIIIGASTGGMVIPLTTENFAKLDVMIIDVPRHYIYYNKFSPQMDGEPTNRKNIADMYRKALGRIFWPGSSINY